MSKQPTNNVPQVSRLQELYWYDPNTGNLIRRIDAGRWGRENAGVIAGKEHIGGYLTVSVDGVSYLAHRVAFAIAHGQWPEGQIDHIDGNRKNNKLLNLRDVSPSINSQNQRTARGKTASGLLGVSRQRKRWKAEIKVSGKKHFLGEFDTPQEAHAAYKSAKRVMHPGCTI